MSCLYRKWIFGCLGVLVFGCSYVQSAPFAYVTNSDSNTVSVIDIATNTVSATIEGLGFAPTGIAITPNGRYAYVANSDSNSVSVIDLANNTVVQTIQNVGTVVEDGEFLVGSIAITPDGRYAYVTNPDGGRVSVIDIASNNAVAGSIVVGIATPGVEAPLSDAFQIAITPNGRYAYVTNGVSTNVSVIDIATNTVSATIEFGNLNPPVGIAITPNGRYAYVTNILFTQNLGIGQVSVIDLANNTVVQTIQNVGTSVPGQFPVGSIAITPDGRYAYVTNNADAQVSVIDITTNSVSARIEGLGENSQQIAITRDGRYAYVANADSNTVSVIDIASNTVLPSSIPVGAFPLGIAILDVSPSQTLMEAIQQYSPFKILRGL